MTRYHLTRKDREIGSPEVIDTILTEARFAAVAMSAGDEPYVVTMNHGYDRERGSLFFHCALKGHKLDVIERNPSVCATVVQDLGYVEGMCEHRYRSLVIRGKMSVVRDLETKKHGIETLMSHHEPDPGPIRARNLADEADYERFIILEMKIEDITGKQSV